MSEDFFIDPGAFCQIIESLREQARGRILERIREAKELADDIRILAGDRLSRIREPRREVSYVGIDSTFASPYLELLSMDCSIVIYGALGKVRGKPLREVRGSFVYSSDGGFGDKLFRKAMELERKLAIDIIEKHEPELVLFDGSIAPFPLAYTREWREWEGIVEILRKLLELAEERGTSLVGVVKRVRSRYLSVILGRDTRMSDKLLASLALRRGECLDLGRIERFLKDYYSIVNPERASEYIHGLNQTISEMPKLGDVEIIFYKSRNPTRYDSAGKLEILDLGKIGKDEIVARISEMTTDTGFPLVIDWIDDLVRNESKALACLRDILEKILVECCEDPEDRETIVKLCGYLNPQKFI